MPDPDFSVHLDPDDLARQAVAAGLSRSAADAQAVRRTELPAHHGARDGKQAARQRSGRDHAGRASSAGGGRSYAFRRS